jgi:recombination protein RecT
MNKNNTEQTNVVAKQDAAPKTLKDLLGTERLKMAVAQALPKHLPAERFIRIAITALTRNPKLQQCSQESFFQCLLDLSALGLEPDNRRAYLIPYEDKRNNRTICTLQLDYKGIVELVRRSGEVSNIHADVVCENDSFDYLFGTGGFLKHKPALTNRGKIICAYSFVKMKDGSEDFDVMNVEDVNAIRDASQGYKTAKKYGKDSIWDNHWNEMAKKSVFRRQSKWLPFSSELREKIEKDDEPLTEAERFTQAKTVNASEVTFAANEPAALPEPAATAEAELTTQEQPELVNA